MNQKHVDILVDSRNFTLTDVIVIDFNDIRLH
jgi:hypothetical protein